MEDISRILRKTCLKLSNISQDGNLQSAFSCIDIIWILYDKIMNWTTETAKVENRDYFIISKGQATLALYAVLIEKGLFSMESFSEIGSFHSRFCIQADPTKFPEGGIENAAGSLGHGLPFAVGLAMAAKIKHTSSRIFVLTGDGEFCEGTMWESCLFAAGKKLDNLCVIIDDNNSVGAMIDMGKLKQKLESFGFDVYETNGHDLTELEKSLSKIPATGKPMAIIADTIRGFGSETLTKHDVWFHKAPNEQELEMLNSEVNAF